jgi:hypothetical protein
VIADAGLALTHEPVYAELLSRDFALRFIGTARNAELLNELFGIAIDIVERNFPRERRSCFFTSVMRRDAKPSLPKSTSLYEVL